LNCYKDRETANSRKVRPQNGTSAYVPSFPSSNSLQRNSFRIENEFHRPSIALNSSLK